MTRFRPCIDLHSGQVKQIVGGTLGARPDGHSSTLQVNWTSHLPPAHYAALYHQHDLHGGHVIMLGSGNEAAAEEALAAWPGQLQLGGGMTAENAMGWFERGAGKIVVTSYLFPGAKFSLQRLEGLLVALGGDKQRLVIDLSCRRVERQGENVWVVAMDRWATLTETDVNGDTIGMLESYCCEFLVHAADVEGKCSGIDEELVKKLGEWCSIPVTYAGGARYLADLDLVETLSGGKVDLTIGSALDIFGGAGVSLEECVRWNQEHCL